MTRADLLPRLGRLLLVILIASVPCQVFADTIRVATASNFRAAMVDLAGSFEKKSGHKVTLISGASGKHYAQIIHGAPFDTFFSADAERPERLESEGLAIPGSRFTYAVGKLVLWSPQTGLVDSHGEVLKSTEFRHLSIANPELAPYGRAAKEVLLALGVWDKIANRLVRGENVSQAFQFVHSRNAELGLVAYSQLRTTAAGGSYWLIPQSLYQPIEQQAVLLRENTATQDFMAFVRSEQGRKIILDHGYDTAGPDTLDVQ